MINLTIHDLKTTTSKTITFIFITHKKKIKNKETSYRNGTAKKMLLSILLDTWRMNYSICLHISKGITQICQCLNEQKFIKNLKNKLFYRLLVNVSHPFTQCLPNVLHPFYSSLSNEVANFGKKIVILMSIKSYKIKKLYTWVV